ncbi:MAG: N-acetyl-gamma-glutamyl-phosphate reductase [Anaeroplasmataceae bacterium]
MKYKVFIDGKEGTTGLRIYERFQNRDDVEIINISDELRKDPLERKKCINSSDITFLCLPDAAAIEAVSLCDNPNTKIIDASTAHRTNSDWAYGFPELGDDFLNKIKSSKRVAVPGCYASGFMSIVYPLVKLGICANDYPFSANAISGYSGAGKKAIAQYEDLNRDSKYDAPRLYAMGQMHKHLKEMQAIGGLKEKPLFNPYVCDFLQGMLVTIPLYVDRMNKKMSPLEVHNALEEFYKDKQFVRVMPYYETGTEDGFISANHLSGKDYLEIYVAGNEERINITACLDNLGKGASGAAIECMNIMLGLEETTGLVLD